MSAALSTQDKTPLDKFGWNTVAKHILSPIFLAAIFFALAGVTFWGIIFNVVHTLVWLVMTLILMRANPGLLNVRGHRKLPGTKDWDMILLSIYGIAWILMIVMGAVDIKQGWTGPVATWVYLLGNLLVIAGFALLTWAMAVNRSFETAVRIQTEREHRVIDAGPYQYVRHPGYTAVIIAFYFGMPMAMGSWVAFGIGLVGLVTMVVRTSMEDRTLQAELPGYAEFTQKTRYRLLPGLW